MDEVKRARAALAETILNAVKEFEGQFPDVHVECLSLIHERGLSGNPLKEVRVEVRL